MNHREHFHTHANTTHNTITFTWDEGRTVLTAPKGPDDIDPNNPLAQFTSRDLLPLVTGDTYMELRDIQFGMRRERRAQRLGSFVFGMEFHNLTRYLEWGPQAVHGHLVERLRKMPHNFGTAYASNKVRSSRWGGTFSAVLEDDNSAYFSHWDARVQASRRGSLALRGTVNIPNSDETYITRSYLDALTICGSLIALINHDNRMPAMEDTAGDTDISDGSLKLTLTPGLDQNDNELFALCAVDGAAERAQQAGVSWPRLAHDFDFAAASRLLDIVGRPAFLQTVDLVTTEKRLLYGDTGKMWPITINDLVRYLEFTPNESGYDHLPIQAPDISRLRKILEPFMRHLP